MEKNTGKSGQGLAYFNMSICSICYDSTNI